MSQSAEQDLIEDIGGFTHDPLGHALYAFPWGEGELKDHPGPRKWQRELLEEMGSHLQNPETRHQPLQVAVASGHGIGKSALIGMVMTWALDTCEDCKIVLTANTEVQLRTKTWPEVTKWRRLSITRDWFRVGVTAIEAIGEHQRSWRADRVTWSERNTEAFAGLHNVGKRLVVICDEASAIADKVWEVTEGALTDEGTEIIWIVFGNPTRAEGRFRECFKRYRHRWKTRQIDSRDVEGTNKAQLQRWIEDYGVDSDFVKVRVRGLFPNMSSRQFIGEAEVDAAYGRALPLDAVGEWTPRILTLDNAWEGDDEIAFGLRAGLSFKILAILPKNDNDVHIANMLARFEDEHRADAVFIDFGYGTGVASVGRTLGRNWILVPFAGDAADPGCLNKRADMYNDGKRWLKEGGAIPEDQRLRDELLSIETVPRMDGKLQLEAKKEIKARCGFSTGRADALMLSFAFPVTQRRARQAAPEKAHDEFGYG